LKCIVDTNILIDLYHGDILVQLFDLALDIFAPDMVLDELTEPDRRTLQQQGLKSVSLTLEQLLEAAQMHGDEPRLSLGDCTALIAARDENVMLLTGDKRLRDLATSLSVMTHGVLWILDEFESTGQLSGRELTDCLRKMLAEGARLPVAECVKRLERWDKH